MDAILAVCRPSWFRCWIFHPTNLGSIPAVGNSGNRTKVRWVKVQRLNHSARADFGHIKAKNIIIAKPRHGWARIISLWRADLVYSKNTVSIPTAFYLKTVVRHPLFRTTLYVTSRFVCLLTGLHKNYSTDVHQIWWKHGPRKTPLDFGGNPDYVTLRYA